MSRLLYGDDTKQEARTLWTTDPSMEKCTKDQRIAGPKILDLRSAEDFDAAHVPNSISSPLAEMTKDSGSPFDSVAVLEQQWTALKKKFAEETFSSLFAEVSSDGLLLICYNGETSRLATAILRSQGVVASSVRGGAIELRRSS
jgi:rhodanese-related sulfurtransferase